MTSLEFLAQFPKHGDFSRKSKILLFAFYLRKYKGQAEFGSTEIRACFQEAMLRVPGDLSQLLKALSKGRQTPIIRSRTPNRYSLSIHGQTEVEAILPETTASSEVLGSFLDAALPYLKRTIAKIDDDIRREFLAEAIACLGVEARRATIVMVWLATVDHMQEYVLTKKCADFNAALTRRSDKLSQLSIAARDDFGDIKDAAFIEVCRSAKIITNDVRKILEEKLGTRNSCAHPATIQVGDSKVVSFIEDLVDNVIAKYEL
ncbi:MAG: hypothetical protein WEB06_20640 [Actinomycetota bacterium]